MKSVLVKKININDTVSVYDKNMYKACVAWKLSADDVEKIFPWLSRLVQKRKEVYIIPCPVIMKQKFYMKGKNLPWK